MRTIILGVGALAIGLCFGAVGEGDAGARGRRSGDGAPTLEEAITQSEQALDAGRVGDAIQEAERLQRQKGLPKDLQRRVDLIVARSGLVTGEYTASERLLGRLRKAAPKDARLKEWHARALEGAGKGDDALPLFRELAASDELVDGDSYWALAQLERSKGKNDEALTYARRALEKPIVLQSDELDQSIHRFIKDLSTTSKPKN